MQTVNQDIVNQSQSEAGGNRQRYWPKSRLRKLVGALWQRMRQLYGHKWVSQYGPAKMENGTYSPEFLLWCQKLENLTDVQLKRGFERLEFLVNNAGKNGKEIWPPSYAEFIGYCQTPQGQKSFRLFPSNVDPKAPPLALPDKAAIERARAAGAEHLAAMKNLFA